MYQMHRPFCATPWNLEAERRAFYEILLALQCVADPALPTHSVTVLHKRRPSGKSLDAGTPEPHAAFTTTAEFTGCVNSLLSRWLAFNGSYSQARVPAG